MSNECTIINSEKPYHSLQLKTVSFSAQNIVSKKQVIRQSYQRISSSQSAKVNEKNFEVAMKLNVNYQGSKQIEFNTEPKKSLVKSLRNNTSVSPKKQYKMYIKLTNSDEGVNKKISPFTETKFGNYKCFPKRQPKLKNSSPYKFYMFGAKSHEKYKQIQNNGGRDQLLNIKDFCTFVPDNSPPIHSKRHVKEIKYKSELKNTFQPWNFLDADEKNDQLIF